MDTSVLSNISAARSSNGQPLEKYSPRFRSIAEMLKHHVESTPDKAFLVFYDENGKRAEFSYAAFERDVRRVARVFQEFGLESGDRLATASHNHYDTIVVYVACWCLGACVVPLNMTEDNNRLEYILQSSEATLLVCRQEYVERLRQCDVPDTMKWLQLESDQEENDVFSLAHSAAPIELSQQSMLRNECLIVYTSGTTGPPKGVVLEQVNMIADAESIAAWHGIDSHTRMMCVLPIHHVNGTIVTHVTPLFAGASVVLNRKFSVSKFFERLASEHVNIVSVVPTLLAFLLEAKADASNIDHSVFRHIICGAGPLTCELASSFEREFDLRIVHGYGLSETTCYSCFIPTDLNETEHKEWQSSYGFPSIGIPVSNNEMAIHDANGNSLSEGERGEIVIRGATVMKEYFNNEKANASTFAHGWFRSGDEGFFHRDSSGRPYFFITGRLKELIIRGGVNIAPLEIDEVLCSIPGVSAGICVGFPHDMYGEEIGALVVVSDKDLSEQDILETCRAQLPTSKCPKVVLFTEELPVTSTGKYQRNKVKHLFSEFQSTQFPK